MWCVFVITDVGRGCWSGSPLLENFQWFHGILEWLRHYTMVNKSIHEWLQRLAHYQCQNLSCMHSIPFGVNQRAVITFLHVDLVHYIHMMA
jgi:hypothetical protein